MTDHDEKFENATSGASHTFPASAGSIKKNGFCMLKGHPCRVVDYSTSKTGKHGHAKAHIVGLDIFTGKKYEDMCPTSHNVDVPHLKRTEYQVTAISDDYPSLMDEKGEIREDLTLPTDSEGNPTDLAKKIVELYNEQKTVVVTVLSSCGIEQITSYKTQES